MSALPVVLPFAARTLLEGGLLYTELGLLCLFVLALNLLFFGKIHSTLSGKQRLVPRKPGAGRGADHPEGQRRGRHPRQGAAAGGGEPRPAPARAFAGTVPRHAGGARPAAGTAAGRCRAHRGQHAARARRAVRPARGAARSCHGSMPARSSRSRRRSLLRTSSTRCTRPVQGWSGTRRALRRQRAREPPLGRDRSRPAAAGAVEPLHQCAALQPPRRRRAGRLPAGRRPARHDPGPGHRHRHRPR